MKVCMYTIFPISMQKTVRAQSKVQIMVQNLAVAATGTERLHRREALQTLRSF